MSNTNDEQFSRTWGSERPTRKVPQYDYYENILIQHDDIVSVNEDIMCENDSEWPEKSLEASNNAGNSVEKSVLDLAGERIGERQGGYGHEDAFQDIADEWNLWFWQRFRLKINLTPADAACMLSVFKKARRMVRLRQGKTKQDDTVDQLGYIAWRDRKER